MCFAYCDTHIHTSVYIQIQTHSSCPQLLGKHLCKGHHQTKYLEIQKHAYTKQMDIWAEYQACEYVEVILMGHPNPIQTLKHLYIFDVS